MSTDYCISIRRKADDKEIAYCGVNSIKNILDSEFSNLIHCDGRINANDVRFESSDLDMVYKNATNKIACLNDEIVEKKLLIASAKSVEVMRELEAEINDCKEYITELNWVLWSAATTYGIIDCAVEDMMKTRDVKDDDEFKYVSAYKYNAEDLPKDENGWYRTIWMDDVYCILEAY